MTLRPPATRAKAASSITTQLRRWVTLRTSWRRIRTSAAEWIFSGCTSIEPAATAASALLRCRVVGAVWGAAVHSSDGEDEFGEGLRDPMPRIDVGG
jgi:hypothetical protein